MSHLGIGADYESSGHLLHLALPLPLPLALPPLNSRPEWPLSPALWSGPPKGSDLVLWIIYPNDGQAPLLSPVSNSSSDRGPTGGILLHYTGVSMVYETRIFIGGRGRSMAGWGRGSLYPSFAQRVITCQIKAVHRCLYIIAEISTCPQPLRALFLITPLLIDPLLMPYFSFK